MNVIPLRATPGDRTPVQVIGQVAFFLPDGQIGVEDESGAAWRCRRAASCLLKPEVGDTVLLSGPDRERVWLIAVTEQADASASCIEASGDITLVSREGAVRIEGARDVRLKSGAALRMESEQWALRADRGDCRVADMQFTAETADVTVGRMRAVGKVFETVADRLVQMARNALRLVDEIDQSRVGHLDCKAAQTVRIHGSHTLVTGQELVKVDASQIHMG